MNLAGETDLRSAIDAMFNGDKINMTGTRRTAHRPAQPLRPSIEVDGKDVMPEVNAVLAKMKGFCEKGHRWRVEGLYRQGHQHVVNIGIGGLIWAPS